MSPQSKSLLPTTDCTEPVKTPIRGNRINLVNETPNPTGPTRNENMQLGRNGIQQSTIGLTGTGSAEGSNRNVSFAP